MNYKPSTCLYELLQITFNYATLSSKHLTKQQMWDHDLLSLKLLNPQPLATTFDHKATAQVNMGWLESLSD